MPVTPTYPGVYIEEIPSGVRTLVGVATSITAFIGRALRGPVNEPTRIQSFGDYERVFGGLWLESTMSYAIQHFFLNNGTDAIVVRIVHTGDANSSNDADAARAIVDGLDLTAANEGDWGDRLKAIVDYDTKDPSDTNLFNLTIQELASTDPADDVVASEVFRNVSVDPASPRYVKNVLENQSTFARVGVNIPMSQPTEGDFMFTFGNDGTALTFTDYEGSEANRTGLYALDKADLFNLLCIPPFTRDTDVATSTWSAALAYCKDRRAMLIVDPPSHDPVPSWHKPSDVIGSADGVG